MNEKKVRSASLQPTGLCMSSCYYRAVKNNKYENKEREVKDSASDGAEEKKRPNALLKK